MSEAGPSRSAATILIVDDDSYIGSIIDEYLTAKGYQVRAASSGDQALELRQHHPDPIDLVITDMLMPGMTGAELVAHLLDTQPALRVIYMSGYSDEPQVEQRAGVSAVFLGKPFTMQELLQHVQAMLD